MVDTNHFKGNFPESVLVEACLAMDAPDAVSAFVCRHLFVRDVFSCNQNVFSARSPHAAAAPQLLSGGAAFFYRTVVKCVPPYSCGAFSRSAVPNPLPPVTKIACPRQPLWQEFLDGGQNIAWRPLLPRTKAGSSRCVHRGRVLAAI